MITREELNAYRKIEKYSIEIAELLNKIDSNMYRMGWSSSIDYVNIDDEEVTVNYSGYNRGDYTESISFPIDYLFKSLKEIEAIEIIKKEERETKTKKEIEENKKKVEEKERKLFEELKQKYEGGK